MAPPVEAALATPTSPPSARITTGRRRTCPVVLSTLSTTAVTRDPISTRSLPSGSLSSGFSKKPSCLPPRSAKTASLATATMVTSTDSPGWYRRWRACAPEVCSKREANDSSDAMRAS